jgi:hypothetical protein
MERSMEGSHLLDAATGTKGARWLQTLEGDAPVLLIAPHGGHAGPATRALLNPKVNDLHTADITRELARRLGASAIINSGMDRNRLDLNRLSQVMSEAPWMLELIAGRVERIVARSGRAVVLLIHGWNIIEPRVDLGVGVKSAGGKLLPACAAHVSASDGFINGPLADFAEFLRQSGIKPTFGMRYPGAGANNLLQAFTQRHASSKVDALRRLAALHARGALEAVQLELSVALRMPGRLRTQTIAGIAESFARCDRHAAAPRASRLERPRRIEIIRTAEPALSAPKLGIQQSSAAPLRVGLEFFDSSIQLGAMASFDLGPGAGGARVMAVAGRERIALFTAEGRVERTPQSLTLGPLALRIDGRRLRFDFSGPAVVVEDGSAYLSVERALAQATLQEAMELHVEFEPWPDSRAAAPATGTLIELMTRSEQTANGIFGRVTGHFSIAGAEHRLEAVGRLGRSLIGIGNGAFNARRMIWAALPGTTFPLAVEARALIDAGGVESSSASVLDHGGWSARDVQLLKVTPVIPGRLPPGRPPHRISAILPPAGDGLAVPIKGEVQSFVMLSRPGPAQSRILTSLGFASFRIGDHHGAGMFECSHRSALTTRETAEATDADNGES